MNASRARIPVGALANTFHRHAGAVLRAQSGPTIHIWMAALIDITMQGPGEFHLRHVPMVDAHRTERMRQTFPDSRAQAKIFTCASSLLRSLADMILDHVCARNILHFGPSCARRC